MTVLNQVNKVIQDGNGVASDFPFNPMVLPEPDTGEAHELLVVITSPEGVETELTEGVGPTNYIVNVATYPGTGSVTYPADLSSRLPSGWKITMKRLLVIDQEVRLRNQGPYNPDVIEQDIADRLVMYDLQQQEEIDRSVKGNVSDPSQNMTLPTAKERRARVAGYTDTDAALPTVGGSTLEQVDAVVAEGLQTGQIMSEVEKEGDGVTTGDPLYTLDNVTVVNDVSLLVYFDGVVQGASTYSIDTTTKPGSTIVNFNTAPPAGVIVYIRIQGYQKPVGMADAGDVYYDNGEIGSRITTVEAVFQDRVRLTEFSGIDPTGKTDSFAGLMAAKESGKPIDMGPGIFAYAGTLILDKDKEWAGVAIHDTVNERAGTWLKKTVNDGQPCVLLRSSTGLRDMMIGHDPSIPLTDLINGSDAIRIDDGTVLSWARYINLNLRWNRRGFTTTDGASQSCGAFSCLFDTVRVRKFTGAGFRLAGSNIGQTGNVLLNIYLANAQTDTFQNDETIFQLSAMVDTAINQINIEWINQAVNQLAVFEAVEGLTINGFHLEGCEHQAPVSADGTWLVFQNGNLIKINGLRARSMVVPNTYSRFALATFKTNDDRRQSIVRLNGTINVGDEIQPGTFSLLRGVDASISSDKGASLELENFITDKDFAEIVNNGSNQDRARIASKINYVYDDGAVPRRVYYDRNQPRSYTVATVPPAAGWGAGAMIYVSDEVGGPVMAFSDGTNWLRCTDRAIIS